MAFFDLVGQPHRRPLEILQQHLRVSHPGSQPLHADQPAEHSARSDSIKSIERTLDFGGMTCQKRLYEHDSRRMVGSRIETNNLTQGATLFPFNCGGIATLRVPCR